MTTFQLIALLLTVVWLVIVVTRFRRSTAVLVAGLFTIGIFTLIAIVLGKITPTDLGLEMPDSWLLTIGFALGWLILMLAYSRLADWLASRWFKKPPTLEAFRSIQQSIAKLIAGIIVAWILGGFLEELIARGIVLASIDSWLAAWLSAPAAATVAVIIAAAGAGTMHLYQGPRAAVIIFQLSILFGVLFVITGYNLWAVIICHGLYDTIAFIRFALKKSRYSQPGSG